MTHCQHCQLFAWSSHFTNPRLVSGKNRKLDLVSLAKDKQEIIDQTTVFRRKWTRFFIFWMSQFQKPEIGCRVPIFEHYIIQEKFENNAPDVQMLFVFRRSWKTGNRNRFCFLFIFHLENEDGMPISFYQWIGQLENCTFLLSLLSVIGLKRTDRLLLSNRKTLDRKKHIFSCFISLAFVLRFFIKSIVDLAHTEIRLQFQQFAPVGCMFIMAEGYVQIQSPETSQNRQTLKRI